MPDANGNPTDDEIAAAYFSRPAQPSPLAAGFASMPVGFAPPAPPPPPPAPAPSPAAPLAPVTGPLPPGVDASWGQPPPAPPPKGSHTVPSVAPTPAAGLAAYSASLRPEGAPPPAAPAPSPPPGAGAITIPEVKIKASPGVAGTGGVGGTGGLGALQKKVDASQAAHLGTFDEAKESKKKEVTAEVDKSVMLAQRHAELANLQQEDAFSAKAEELDAQRRFDQHTAQIQQQINDVRAKKIDPRKLMKDNPALVATSIVGGALAGFYQGLTGGKSNQFLDDVDSMIDTQMKADKDNLENEKSALGEQMNLLGQQRAIYKDHQLAELQARNLHYESLKSEIEAESMNHDSPIIQARGEQAIGAINEKQKELMVGIDKQKLATAQAQAAAAAAQARAARKERMDYQIKLIELGLKEKEIEGKNAEHAHKAGEAFVKTGQDENGNPVGFNARNAETAAKITESLTAADELLANIQEAKRLRGEQGMLGRAANREAPLGVYTPEWQTKIRSLEKEIGVGWSKAKGGMGTFDNGIERLISNIVGDLQSVGETSDERLEELERRINGAKANMIAHQAGSQTSPLNPKTVPRTPVK